MSFTPKTYRPGDSYVICEICGFKRYRSDCCYNWKKNLVCKDTCWEPKHPQLSVKTRIDRITADDGRAEPADVFLGANDVNADDL